MWDMKFTSPSNSVLETSLGKHEIGPAIQVHLFCLFPKGNAANFNKAGRDFLPCQPADRTNPQYYIHCGWLAGHCN